MASVMQSGKDSYVVSYPQREGQQTLPKHHYDAILTLCEAGHILPAIKFVRAEYNLSLYDAKSLCDTIHNQPRIV